jgi:hypothetical protein
VSALEVVPDVEAALTFTDAGAPSVFLCPCPEAIPPANNDAETKKDNAEMILIFTVELLQQTTGKYADGSTGSA